VANWKNNYKCKYLKIFFSKTISARDEKAVS
jgi:hypothetical protein